MIPEKTTWMETQDDVDRFVLFCQARDIKVMEDPVQPNFVVFEIEELLPYIEVAIKEFPLLSNIFAREDPPKPSHRFTDE